MFNYTEHMVLLIELVDSIGEFGRFGVLNLEQLDRLNVGAIDGEFLLEFTQAVQVRLDLDLIRLVPDGVHHRLVLTDPNE